MSILPTQAQRSQHSSSSQALPQSPNSQHANHLLQQSPPPSLPRQIQFSMRHQLSGTMAPTAEDSGGSAEEVTELVTPNGNRNLSHQSTDRPSWSPPGAHRVGSGQSKGKMPGTVISPRSQQSIGSRNSHGNTPHLAGRRAQMINGNHLLNFYYDPISRPQPRAPPTRRLHKIKPYNKDLFLQANYKFVMLDSGNYSPELMDPDKMLQWEDIICVRYSTPFPVQCPICLEYPLCPQITSCGHIFCFPCILQYLLMGEEDHKGDCFRRCPLCFVMISPKDLYTIYIENVMQYAIGDTIEFMLLTRQKDSFTLSQKNRQDTDSLLCCNDEIHDPFSKCTFTSDVDLSVRKAISDLDSWLVKTDSGFVDDLEKLPYVCAAMEQLEQRKKYWNEHRASDSNKPCKYADCETGSHALSSPADATNVDYKAACGFGCGTQASDANDQKKWSGNLTPFKTDGSSCLDQTADVGGSMEDRNTLSSSPYDEHSSLQRHLNGSKDIKDKDSYNFYQAADGQHFILHPLNMKCLLHHYGSYGVLPDRIRGKILELETVTQSEAMRRRYRYLSHFSLTTTFQLCEIDLSEMLPPDALFPFMDEIKKREKHRQQIAKKEWKDKIKAEAAAAQSIPIIYGFGQSSQDDPPSLDDFEALGSCTVTSSSPPIVGERRLFSSVTRLGFAAGHDSPALKMEEEVNSLRANEVTSDSSGATGSTNTRTPSFANITNRAKSIENLDVPKNNGMGKKGKKPSRVLMSTSGGRRY